MVKRKDAVKVIKDNDPQPEPQPSLEPIYQIPPITEEEVWMDDVLFNVHDATVKQLHTYNTPYEKPISPHPLQISNFCKLTSYSCIHNYKQHWQFQQQLSNTLYRSYTPGARCNININRHKHHTQSK